MHKKRFNTLFKKWVQFCVGAIPRLPLVQCTLVHETGKYREVNKKCGCNNSLQI